MVPAPGGTNGTYLPWKWSGETGNPQCLASPPTTPLGCPILVAGLWRQGGLRVPKADMQRRSQWFAPPRGLLRFDLDDVLHSGSGIDPTLSLQTTEG